MTTSVVRGEYATCVDCGGSGVLGTGEREHETGVYVAHDCTTCSGDGTVDADWVLTCEGCSTGFWAGTGCTHHGIHCPACAPARCDDCADTSRLLLIDTWSLR